MTKSIFTRTLQILSQKREENKICDPEKINVFSFQADTELEARGVAGLIGNAFAFDTFVRINNESRDMPTQHEKQRLLNLDLQFKYDEETHNATFTLPPGYLIADLERYIELQKRQLFEDPLPLAVGHEDPDLPAGMYYGTFLQAMSGPNNTVLPIAARLIGGTLETLLQFHGTGAHIYTVPHANDLFEAWAGAPPPGDVSLVIADRDAYQAVKNAEYGGKAPTPPR